MTKKVKTTVVISSSVTCKKYRCVPARLNSRSVVRVLEPVAVSRLMDWSVRTGQCDRSNLLSNGMCLIISFSVESLTSRPDNRKVNKPFSLLRVSLPRRFKAEGIRQSHKIQQETLQSFFEQILFISH